jgi:Protein of unknown function with PCYCGC motif
MNEHRITRFRFCLLVSWAILISGAHADGQTPASKTERKLAFHDHPPVGPLPATLDPGSLNNNHPAFVAYVLAAQIRELLYQEPCFCPCDKHNGHQSLLDCFIGDHGISCHLCQQEAIFCFREHKRGKNPTQIREALNHGKAWDLAWKTDVEHLYRELQGEKP